MKLKLVVALLGLTACVPAFAVDFVQNTSTQSVIGTSPGTEPSLQTIVNNLFVGSSINVNTDQSSAAFFSSATPERRFEHPDPRRRIHQQREHAGFRNLVRYGHGQQG
jgi:hypothetical protein